MLPKFISNQLISALIIFIFSSFYCQKAFSAEEAVITVDTEQVSNHEIPPELFGGFIEFLNNFINGPEGMWAQEIMDRGFDAAGDQDPGVSKYWNRYTENSTIDAELSLEDGGYNPNGVFSQKITKNSGDGLAGVSQKVYLADSVEHPFYVYFKGDIGNSSLIIQLQDVENREIIYESELDIPDDNWQKNEIVIPAIPGVHYANLIIGISTPGYIYVDEVSLMPNNNVFGVRKEFYEIYNKWKPGVIRYPGGSFADFHSSKLKHSIGDIDKRNSPNFGDGKVPQRMGLGTDEFIQFCDSLGIEPHITVNYYTGAPEEAAAWVEYCNGSVETKWGARRAANGHPEPYNVKYWEIGNEQWNNVDSYAIGYVDFYDAMKEVDSSIVIMIDGNHWTGKTNFEKLMGVVGKKCQIYGYHPAQSGRAKEPCEDKIIYLSMVGGSVPFERHTINRFNNLLIEWKLFPEVKQGVTEWMSLYSTRENWLLDKDVRNSSLESGLWSAAYSNVFVKNSKYFIIGERTVGLGGIRGRIKKETGERIIFATPTIHAFSLMRNHIGERLLPSQVTSETYDTPLVEGLWQLKNIPYLDASASVSKDSLFLIVINRHPDSTIKTELQINCDFTGKDAMVYELTSDSYLDANTVDEPYKVVPAVKQWQSQKYYDFPPHSLSILAIPCEGILSVDSNNNEDKLFYASPNPSNSLFEIKFYEPIKNISQLSVYNVLGEKIKQKRLYPGQNEILIYLVNYSSGNYFVNVKTKHKSETIIIHKY